MDARERFEHCTERLRFRQEGKRKNKVGLGTVNKSKGGHGNYERMQVLKTMTATSADAMPIMP